MGPEQRRNIIVLVVLFIVLGGVVYYMYFRPSDDGAVAADGGTAEMQQIETVFVDLGVDVDELLASESIDALLESDIDQIMENIQEVDFVYNDEQLARDPMLPLVGSAQNLAANLPPGSRPEPKRDELIYEANAMPLSAIIYDPVNPSRSLAVLNKETISQGYEFENGITVKTIEPSHVILSLRVNDEELEILKELEESEQ